MWNSHHVEADSWLGSFMVFQTNASVDVILGILLMQLMYFQLKVVFIDQNELQS